MLRSNALPHPVSGAKEIARAPAPCSKGKTPACAARQCSRTNGEHFCALSELPLSRHWSERQWRRRSNGSPSAAGSACRPRLPRNANTAPLAAFCRSTCLTPRLPILRCPCACRSSRRPDKPEHRCQARSCRLDQPDQPRQIIIANPAPAPDLATIPQYDLHHGRCEVRGHLGLRNRWRRKIDGQEQRRALRRAQPPSCAGHAATHKSAAA